MESFISKIEEDHPAMLCIYFYCPNSLFRSLQSQIKLFFIIIETIDFKANTMTFQKYGAITSNRIYFL